jgi:murein L,D-transpeptidase YafK
MGNFKLFLFILAAAAFLGGCAGSRGELGSAPAVIDLPEEPRPTVLTPEQRYIDQLLTKNGFNGKGPKPTVIVVHKLSRKLTTYRGLTPLKTYPVVLGTNPLNDKLYQGDMCTPEGVYRVRAKYPHPKWSYFIWLDYPNTQNWLKFGRAKQAGRLPPDVDIGGQIGIHGTEDDLKNLQGENWTQGCVSLTNKDMEDIYPLVDEKTTLVVIKRD